MAASNNKHRSSGEDSWMKELTSLSQMHVPDRHTANEARSLIAQDKTAVPNVSPSTYWLQTGIETTTQR